MVQPPAARVPFDPEVAVALAAIHEVFPTSMTPDMIGRLRELNADFSRPVSEIIGRRSISLSEHRVPGLSGAPDVPLSILRTDPGSSLQPLVYFCHGGGMFMGDRFSGADEYVEWIAELGVAVATVEYRLAPEHPYPAPVQDCYAGLLWLVEHADELGFDRSRVVVAGVSAGGGLAASVALMARDLGGPEIAGQLLICSMLDDRNNTASAELFEGIGMWDRISNDTGWRALLGERAGTDDVPPYAAPAREMVLAGLPTSFLDVGTAETFRDEVIQYAANLVHQGVQMELHVWPGGYHGFDVVVPTAGISVAARQARVDWLSRVLGR